MRRPARSSSTSGRSGGRSASPWTRDGSCCGGISGSASGGRAAAVTAASWTASMRHGQRRVIGLPPGRVPTSGSAWNASRPATRAPSETPTTSTSTRNRRQARTELLERGTPVPGRLGRALTQMARRPTGHHGGPLTRPGGILARRRQPVPQPRTARPGKEVIAGVQEAEKSLTTDMQAAERENTCGARLAGMEHRLKGEDRLKEKIAEKIEHEPGRTNPRERIREDQRRDPIHLLLRAGELRGRIPGCRGRLKRVGYQDDLQQEPLA